MLIIVILVIFIPMHLAFGTDFEIYSFVEISIFVLILDSLIYLNTKIYNNGILIKGRKIIFLNYMKNRFWFDILTIFPLIYFSHH